MNKLILEIPGKHEFDSEAILKILARGFRTNVATLNKDGSYSLPRCTERVFIHPESVLFQEKTNQRR